MARTQKNQRNYTIWTLAGAVALVALVVGLASNSSAEKITQPGQQIPSSQTAKQAPSKAPRIDVVFTIDATGSMGDEIDAVKKEIWTIANGLMAGTPKPDIRFGLVFYQDVTDTFLTETVPLTRDIDQIHEKLMAIQAGGGGDWEEHVGRGLHDALALNWDMHQNTSRIMYLVGDAPGHDDYNDGYSIDGALEKANQSQIKINTIGCSGLRTGDAEYRKIANRTGGKFAPLTYQIVLTNEQGKQQSVISYDGQYYEAEGVLDKKEWSRGADKLIKSGKLKKARPSNRSKAAAAPSTSFQNNVGDYVLEDVANEAESKGVAY